MAGAYLTRADWLRTVPDLATDCCKEWGLQLGEPYEAGAAGYAARAELPDGTPAVLKLIYPHRESEHEADALALWRGAGAVLLLAHDRERAFDAASLLRDRRPELATEPHPVARMRRRLDQLAERLEVDRERMRRWAVIHALAWGMEDERSFADILACAEWLHGA